MSIEKKSIEKQSSIEKFEKINLIGRVIGEDLGMRVDVGTKPGWRYIFHPVNKIEIDPDDLEKKSENYCLGVIAHEGSHRKISRIKMIPKNEWQETGFSFLMNAVEDPRVNNWVAGKYDGAKDWLHEVYDTDLISKKSDIETTAKQKVGYAPKHIQYGLQVIHHWHTGKYTEDLDKDVLDALQATAGVISTAYQCLPAPTPTEEDINLQADLTYQLVRQCVWPRYKKLVEQAKEEEKLNQLMQDMQGEGGGDDPNQPESVPDQPDADSAPDQDEDNQKPDKKDSQTQWGDLTEEQKNDIKEQIEQWLDGKDEKERKEIEDKADQKAQDNLDELDEELGQKMKGKFTDQPETKSEEKKRKEAEAEEAKKQAELEKELQKALDEIESQKSPYEKVLSEVKNEINIDKIAEEIVNLFSRSRFPQFRKGPTGQSLAGMKEVMKWESARDYKKLWKIRQPSEKKDFNFMILVDLSSSMRGEKIKETIKGVVMFTEIFKRVESVIGNLKFDITGFQDVLIDCKSFNQELDDGIKANIVNLTHEVSNRGQHNRASYNNDGYCLNQAYHRMQDNLARNNFLIVLSDGGPCGDSTHHLPGFDSDSEEKELKHMAGQIESDPNIHLIGIGLGEDTEHVAEYYQDNYPGKNIKELSKQLANIIQKYLK